MTSYKLSVNAMIIGIVYFAEKSPNVNPYLFKISQHMCYIE